MKRWEHVCGYSYEDREEKSGICAWWRKNKRGKRIKENKDREKKSGNVCGGEKPRGKKGKKSVSDWAKFIPKHKDFDKFQD